MIVTRPSCYLIFWLIQGINKLGKYIDERYMSRILSTGNRIISGNLIELFIIVPAFGPILATVC